MHGPPPPYGVFVPYRDRLTPSPTPESEAGSSKSTPTDDKPDPFDMLEHDTKLHPHRSSSPFSSDRVDEAPPTCSQGFFSKCRTLLMGGRLSLPENAATLPPPVTSSSSPSKESTSPRLVTKRGWIMAFIVAAFVVLAYSVIVQITWDKHNSRRRADAINHIAAANVTGGAVRRHWVHSHNDEMHMDNALTLALSVGVGSIEVDTWLGKDTSSGSIATSSTDPIKRWLKRYPRPTLELAAFGGGPSAPLVSLPPLRFQGDLLEKREQKKLFIGHEAKDVLGRTLDATYIQPILARLEKNNEGKSANDSVVGIYPDDPTAQVQLVIDMKNDGDEIWPYLVDALEPLRAKGYLTTYNTTTHTWTQAPLIVIGTGNTPLHHVYHSNPRVIFYDAPLKHLDRKVHIPETSAGPAAVINFSKDISPMASDKFPIKYHLLVALPPWNPAIVKLQQWSAAATRKGISSRWWGAAHDPKWVRHRIWEIQKEAGATWTNADHVRDAVRWLDGAP